MKNCFLIIWNKAVFDLKNKTGLHCFYQTICGMAQFTISFGGIFGSKGRVVLICWVLPFVLLMSITLRDKWGNNKIENQLLTTFSHLSTLTFEIVQIFLPGFCMNVLEWAVSFHQSRSEAGYSQTQDDMAVVPT